MSKTSRSLKNILKVAFGTFGSRVLGLLRDTLTLAFLGVNAVSSAFFFGFTIPNLFRRLMGEGALSSAFIPIFSQTLKNGGEEKALKTLKDLGLTVTVETKESEKADGTVLAQSKAEGTTATAGDSITITVSKKKKDDTQTPTPPKGNNEAVNDVVVDPDAPAANNEVKE